MGKLHGIVLLALVACGSREKAPTGANDGEPQKLERVALEKLSAPVDPRFDAQGALLGSGRRFAWLELPRGFEPGPGASATSASFEARDMPFSKVRDYFDGRLRAETMRMDERSLHFLRAQPSHTALTMERLDVRLFELEGAGSTVLLRVEQQSRPEGPALPLSAAREELARRRGRAE